MAPRGLTIQQLFGRHDVSGVRAYVGGAARDGAAAMGARAFASGDQVAFAEAPELHTAAHEAAHVVQQRGGVQLAGGVGRAGDPYEQHADAVADRVVQGQSAEALLDTHAGGTHAGGPGVQRILVDDGKTELTQTDVEARLTAAGAAHLAPAFRELAAAEEIYRFDEALRLLQADPGAPLDQARWRDSPRAPGAQNDALENEGTSARDRERSTAPEPMQDKRKTAEAPAPGAEAEPQDAAPSLFKKRKQRGTQRTREASNQNDDDTTVVVKPQPKPKVKSYETPDSAFETWLKTAHPAEHERWMRYDISRLSDEIADRNCQLTVEHLAGNDADLRHLQRALELRSSGLPWGDVLQLVQADFAGYLHDAETAAQHWKLCGCAAMVHYGKDRISAFLKGDVSRAQKYFEATGLQPDGSLRGSHTEMLWNQAVQVHQHIASSMVQQWTCDLEGKRITQYRYADSSGRRHSKTVFQDLEAGNKLLDLATLQALATLSVRDGSWSVEATLPGGPKVTVVFNGNAVAHIT